jgi:phosphopantetheinyl transferase (holo-ACP synthase)
MYIGNDLVAFSEMDCFDRKGYKQKAFTLNEIEKESLYDRTYYYGLLWSCKESAYKVMLKSGLRKSFAPGMYEVTLNSEKRENVLYGIIKYKNIELHSKSEIKNNKYIHTICSNYSEGLEEAMHEAKQISISNYDFQNSEAINFLKEYLGDNFRIRPSEIDIHFDHLKKYPVLFFNSGEKHLDISLSHDGFYVAFALLVTDATTDKNN